MFYSKLNPMKKLFTLLVTTLLTLTLFAQAPQKMSYQAVIRNSSGDLVTNHSIGMRISILQGTASGTSVYVETHTTTTNANGLATIEIGGGSIVSGTFSGINWASGSYFLKTETDPSGGSSYSIVGTSQLLSVPYALDARISESVIDNSITSAKIVDGTIANADIGNNSVTSTKIADATIVDADLAANSVTTEKINVGAVTGTKIAQAGATSGQVLKWSGTTWAPAADATGGGSGGWTDDGTIIRLSTTTDSVQMGSVSRLGKFNVGGNIGLNVTSSIYFGSDETRITGLTGGDLRFVAEDLSMLTTEDITFGHFGDETWIKFDNANKRVGIGTLAPTDRLHVVQGTATAGLSAIRGVATPTAVANYGVSGESKSATGYGVYGNSPKYGVYGTVTGNQGRGVTGEATGTASIGVQGIATNTSSTGVWGEGSNQGIYGYSSSSTGKGVYGKVTSPTGYSGYFEGGKFYVKGSAQVRDTLYASAVKIANSPRVAYEKFSESRTISTKNSWGPMDTITIVAPGPGFIMLNFSGTLTTNHTYLEGTWVGVGISTSPTGGVLAQVWWEFEHQLIGGYYQSPCAVNAVATVSAAGSRKFYIVSYHWGTSAEEDVVHLNHGSFSAMFIPSP